MADYGYKIMLKAPCGVKRFTVFHDNEFMEYHEIGEQAKDRLSAQSCPRCREHHESKEYYPVDIQRGEPDYAGEMHWSDAYPTRVDEWAHPELFA